MLVVIVALLALPGADGAAPQPQRPGIQVQITEAPARLAVDGDAKFVDALVTNQSGSALGPLSWYATFGGDVDTVSGGLRVQALTSGAWTEQRADVSGGTVVVRPADGLGFTLAAGQSLPVQLRFEVAGVATEAEAFCGGQLDVRVGVAPPGAGADALAASSDVMASAATVVDETVLDVQAPASVSVVPGGSTLATVLTTGDSGSGFAGFAPVPLAMGASSPDRLAAIRTTPTPAGLLTRLKQVERATGATVAWLHGGTFHTVDQVADLPVIDLAEGGQAAVTWRFTWPADATAGSGGALVWGAVRDGAMGYLAGGSGSTLVLAPAAAPADPPQGIVVTVLPHGGKGSGGNGSGGKGSGGSGSGGNGTGGNGSGSNGSGGRGTVLAHTGFDLEGTGALAVVLLLAGLVVVLASTGRRTPGRHRTG